MIFQYHALFVIFEKAAKFEIVVLLQIIGGAIICFAVCYQERQRSVCTSAQSDQRHYYKLLRWHNDYFIDMFAIG